VFSGLPHRHRAVRRERLQRALALCPPDPLTRWTHGATKGIAQIVRFKLEEDQDIRRES
jgi:hypothetical protein